MTQTKKNNTLTEQALTRIFLDSNIIQYSADKNKSKSQAFLGLLESLKDQGYELAISEIIITEHLHGLYGKKQKKSYENLSKFLKIEDYCV